MKLALRMPKETLVSEPPQISFLNQSHEHEGIVVMKKGIIAVMLALVGFGICAAWGQDEKPVRVADFMRLKLKHSQKLLEGLVTEDFASLKKNAEELKMLSQESNWKVLQTEDYLQQSIEFRRAVDALTKAADKRNLDGAALAYMDVTMKCVTCHKYVRGIRMAGK